jgi:hypothetical protein
MSPSPAEPESHADPPAPPDSPDTSGPEPAGGTVPDPRSAAPPPGFTSLAPPQSADELGRLGPYRVLGVLGEGGMGVVFRADDPRLRRQIALKVILPRYAADPEARQRFLREARAQAAVEHEHVTPIYEVEEDRGTPYIAMPLLRGTTLAAALKANPRPTVAEVVRIGREVAEGLAAAHAAGLIHRDIKPSNVWLDGTRRRVKVLDFGLARVSERADDPDDPTTERGAILGTPSYMSPEQAQAHPVDGRTDLFGLGVVLYQMATGRLPFAAPTSTAVLLSVVSHDPPAPAELAPDVPPPLSNLIVRLLAKDPAARPASAAAVAEELRRIGRGLAAAVPVAAIPIDPVAGPDPWAELGATEPNEVVRAPRGGGRVPLWASAGAVALGLTLVAGLAWAAYRSVNPKDPQPVARADEPKPPAAQPKDTTAADPNRLVAQRVLDAGGELALVMPDGPGVKLFAGMRVPDGPVYIEWIAIRATPDPAATVEPLRGLTRLNYALFLTGESVTDATLDRLTALPGLPVLQCLSLDESRVTGDGLAHLKRLQGVSRLVLSRCGGVTDAGLAHLRDVSELTFLELDGTPITDAGLRHLAGLPGLVWLQLEKAAVGDAGLAHLKGSTRFRHLVLGDTQVGDAGLAHLAGNRDLDYLNLCGTNVTDAGLATVAGFKGLQKLLLAGLPKVTPGGLAKLAGLTELTELNLDSTRVGDAGLVHLRGMKRLAHLNLDRAGVTDAGLGALAELRGLKELLVRKNQVTEAEVRKLASALPGCKIEWDGPTIEPRK